jgi:hypothetical protein
MPVSRHRHQVEILEVIYKGLNQAADRRGLSTSSLIDAWLFDALRANEPDLAPSTETLRYNPDRARRSDLHAR